MHGLTLLAVIAGCAAGIAILATSLRRDRRRLRELNRLIEENRPHA